MIQLSVNRLICLAGITFCNCDSIIYRFKQAVCGARFRRDGKLVAIGGEEGKLRVFDAESTSGTGKAPLRSVKTSSQSLKIVDFSRNGKTIFSMADDGIIKQWDLGDIGYVSLGSRLKHVIYVDRPL